ncbi:MAG TPA: KamA family radical SAM protein [Gemmatimonadaceae bacterium]|jgi:lysine 2,3-aminomutase|nr:KamA family radical SAM protein [Gemmatimonadaceae bacterium]
MSDWQKILHESVDTLDKLADRFGADVIDVDGLQPAFDNFQMRLTPNVLSTIKEVGDPMWQQYVPTVQELDIVDGVIDSLDEDGDSPVPNITHRYPDRALFLVSPVCASYCRFCTRRRKVGDPEKIPLNQYESAFQYLREHTEIRDVIMSGGDPMMLSDRRLEYLFQRLREIPHIEIIRLGSRITSHLPSRITPEFCEMVKKYHPIYMNTHFNHPAELTPESVAALGRLADAGVPLGCQTVLLRGVNDDPQIMKELMQKLLKARVRPYYIYMADQVAGGEHFRTNVEKGLEIVKALRGWTSGLAVPHFVIDAPGGGGKVPLLPEYVEEINEDEVVFRNYAGERYVYKQPRQPAIAVPGRDDAAAAESDIVPIQVGKKPKPRKKTVARKRRTGT